MDQREDRFTETELALLDAIGEADHREIRLLRGGVGGPGSGSHSRQRGVSCGAERPAGAGRDCL